MDGIGKCLQVTPSHALDDLFSLDPLDPPMNKLLRHIVLEPMILYFETINIENDMRVLNLGQYP